MYTPQSSLFPIYTVQYSNGIKFYWTVWNHHHRVPLIKYGDVFVPVGEHHTRILLATKIIAIAELRMKGEHPKAREVAESIQGMVMSSHFTCQNELDWAAIVFGNDDNWFEEHRGRAVKELAKMLSEH